MRTIMEDCNTPDYDCLSTNWSTFGFGREIHNADNMISIFTINLRSINNKFSELYGYLATFTFKFTFIIIITETWLNADNDVGYGLTGYRSYSVTRADRRGGGVKIYYRDFLGVQIVGRMSGIHQS